MQRGEKTHKKAAAFGMLAPGRVFNSGEYRRGCSSMEKEVEGGTSRRFGVTQPGLPAKEGKRGNIDIFILEGSIEKEIKVGDEFKDITLEQAIGSVLGHEIEHATNKEDLSDNLIK
jgi:hypothetical protein